MSQSPLDHRSSRTGRADLPVLRQAADADLRGLAELLASKPDRQLLGQTEFEVRDRVHKIGAKALETALDERKKGGIKGPAMSCPHCHESARFVSYRPKTVQSLVGTFSPGSGLLPLPSCGAGAVALG